MTDTPKIWGYRIANGKVESKLFDGSKLPSGWKDTPAGMDDEILNMAAEAEKAKAAAEAEAKAEAEKAKAAAK